MSARSASQVHDAVIVGAGFGGMGAAIQLRRQGYDDLVILEREDDLGGTWHVNRYPGLAVDIPSATYSYSFEPNPHWSRLFAPGAELKLYAEHVAYEPAARFELRLGRAAAQRPRQEREQRGAHVRPRRGRRPRAGRAQRCRPRRWRRKPCRPRWCCMTCRPRWRGRTSRPGI